MVHIQYWEVLRRAWYEATEGEKNHGNRNTTRGVWEQSEMQEEDKIGGGRGCLGRKGRSGDEEEEKEGRG